MVGAAQHVLVVAVVVVQAIVVANAMAHVVVLVVMAVLVAVQVEPSLLFIINHLCQLCIEFISCK